MGGWISSSNQLWKEVLSHAEHDFYHLPGYSNVVCNPDCEEVCAYYDRVQCGSLLIPMIKRRIPLEASRDSIMYDAASPYGYGGPVFTRNMSDESVLQGIRNYLDFAAREGVVTTFLRLHPLIGPKLFSSIADTDEVRLINHGPTVSINLSLDINILNGSTRMNHKRDIKKLLELGFQVRIDEWSDYHEFQKIYHQTMSRVGADYFYSFNNNYFVRMRDELGFALHLCSVVSPSGDIAASGLFTRVNNILQYHLGGSADNYLALAPSKLMFYEMQKWAKAKGVQILHLGGGLGARRDSLFTFKSGFATDEHVYQTVRIVHDREHYEELCDRWLQVNQCSTFPDPDYFPLYRSATGSN